VLQDPLTNGMDIGALVRAGLSPRAAAVVIAKRGLLSLGVPRSSIGQAPTGSPTAACGILFAQPEYLSRLQFYGVSMGDLDGDTRRDLVEVHTGYDGMHTTGYAVARDSRTGRALWSVSRDLTSTTTSDFHFLFAVADKVGRPAKAGVLLVRLDLKVITSPTSSYVELGYDLTGLDGHGRQGWHAAFRGSFTVISTDATYTVVYRGIPAQLVQGRFRSAAPDLVVRSLTTTPTGTRTDVRRYALDTGTISTPYGGEAPGLLSPVTDVLLANPYVLDLGVAPDQNGDRRPDLYEVRYVSTNSAGLVASNPSLELAVVVVYRGDTGTPLWQSAPFRLSGIVGVFDAGAVTQPEAGVHDLAVTQTPTSGFSPAGGQPTDRTSSTVMLLAGGTGSLVWALPGTSVFPMYRYHRLPAIGLVSVSTPVGGDGSTVSLDVDVRDGTGLAVATDSHLIKVTSSCRAFFYSLTPGLDLSHDGSPDLMVRTTLFGGKGGTTYGALTLDGSTGKELDRLSTGILSESLTGAGATRVTETVHAHDVTYLVRRGDRVASTLAKVVTPLPTTDSGAWLDSVLGTGTACADLTTWQFVPTPKGRTTPAYREVLSLLGANGRPWWTLTIDPAHPLGSLHRGTGAKDLC